LSILCSQGDVRAQWRATRYKCEMPCPCYKPADAFEDIPPDLWGNGIVFPLRLEGEFTDKVNYIVGGFFALFSAGPFEVHFRGSDIQRWLRPPKKRKPSREKSFWDSTREKAFTWLERHGPPQSGDGGQAKLEKYIANCLADRGHKAVSSTIRVHV